VTAPVYTLDGSTYGDVGTALVAVNAKATTGSTNGVVYDSSLHTKVTFGGASTAPPVTLANGVSLDFDHYDHVDEHHYAFQLGDEEFDAAFRRIRDRDITYYADPACRQPGQVYTGKNGRRGTYFRDPNGHLMEILTPVGTVPV